MTHSAVQEFFKRHALDSPHVGTARAAYEAGGRVDASSTTVPGSKLLDIYKARVNFLSSKSSDHAVQLAAELAAFCTALERTPSCLVSIFAVTAPDGRSYIFFEDATTRALLGTAASYDARLMSDEEYERIWGVARGSRGT
jgi:hypothetical protein